MTYEICLLLMLYISYGFIINILYKASIFVHAHVDQSIKNVKSINLKYI